MPRCNNVVLYSLKIILREEHSDLTEIGQNLHIITNKSDYFFNTNSK